MPYLRLFYHVIWATRGRQPFINDGLSPSLQNCIAGKAVQMGARVHAVGGVEDHIHMAVSVPPSIALSEFVRQVKGSSSHFMNHEMAFPVPFAWQAEYGLISFDRKQLAAVVGYVRQQREHHEGHTTIPALQRVG